MLCNGHLETTPAWPTVSSGSPEARVTLVCPWGPPGGSHLTTQKEPWVLGEWSNVRVWLSENRWLLSRCMK